MANLVNDEVVEAILNTPFFTTALKGLSDDIKISIERILNESFTQGLGVKQIVNKLKDLLNKKFHEVQRVIRTESHRLTEIGHNLEFLDAQAQGIDTKMLLLATLDNRTRAQSAQMDGQISNDKGEFLYPDDNWYIPGDPRMPLKWSINDRERSVQIIDGVSPEIRRSREDGIIPYQTYTDWAKEKGLSKNIYGEDLFRVLRENTIF